MRLEGISALPFLRLRRLRLNDKVGTLSSLCVTRQSPEIRKLPCYVEVRDGDTQVLIEVPSDISVKCLKPTLSGTCIKHFSVVIDGADAIGADIKN